MAFEIEFNFGKSSSEGYKATLADYDDGFVKLLLSTMGSILGIEVDDMHAQSVHIASVDQVDRPMTCLAVDLPGHLKTWLQKEQVPFGMGRRLLVTAVRNGGRSKAPSRSRQSARSGAASQSESGMGNRNDGQWDEIKSCLIHITHAVKAPFVSVIANARLSSQSLLCDVMTDFATMPDMCVMQPQHEKAMNIFLAKVCRSRCFYYCDDCGPPSAGRRCRFAPLCHNVICTGKKST